MIGLVRDLLNELNVNEVLYCHWKSNAYLNRSASGENDLDLLIDRKHAQTFSTIVNKLGFKQASEQPAHRLPGVLDFYGYDRDADRIIHVHAHYQLILGHDATKNYHIPIEDPFLASSCQEGIFKIPSPEFELIVLVIRLMLKHSTWDTLMLRQGRLSPTEKTELDYLQRLASPTRIKEILETYLPVIRPELFNDCLRSFQSKSSWWQRVRLGQGMINALSTFARRPHLLDASLKIWRRAAWPFEQRILQIKDRKRMNNGGLLIAIVGGDGAGKTTLIDEICGWLGENYQISRFHMGKPKWSAWTVLVRGVLKMGRSLGFYPFMKAEIRYTHDPGLIVFPGFPWLIRELCTARDRWITYLRARRQATNGDLVILDRFPLSQIVFMDGPQIDWLTSNEPKNGLINFLGNLEKRYYQKILLPDLLIVLLADPEVAVRRKTEEDEVAVRARSTEIKNFNWKQVRAHVLDANKTKEEVISEAKWLIWSQL